MLKPRKRLVKAKIKEDKFLVFTARAERFMEHYRRQILYGLGAVVAVAALVIAFTLSRASAERTASFETFQARDAFLRGDVQETLRRANAILDDYSGTHAAVEALFLKARAHEQIAEFEDAVRVYKEFTRKHPDDDYYAFGAWYSLGSIAEAEKKYEEAGKNYLQAANRYPKNFQAPEALVAAGRAFRKAGDYDRAKQAFRKIVQNYPESRIVSQVRDELAELEFSLY